ncbi:MAG: hypothetical protein ACC682_13525 [Gemmatimonadota bacterium]
MPVDETFDVSRAQLDDPDMFERFRVPDRGEPLREAGLSDDTDLMLIERGGETRAFLLHQLTYHHVAQGELAGEPYVVSF